MHTPICAGHCKKSALSIHTGMTLRGINLTNAYLYGMTWRGINLINAYLYGMTRRGINLTNAYLYGMTWREINLINAYICGMTWRVISLAGTYQISGTASRDINCTSKCLLKCLLVLPKLISYNNNLKWSSLQ